MLFIPLMQIKGKTNHNSSQREVMWNVPRPCPAAPAVSEGALGLKVPNSPLITDGRSEEQLHHRHFQPPYLGSQS